MLSIFWTTGPNLLILGSGLCKWETIFLWQRGYLWTLLALPLGVVFRAVHYSFGHFPYSELMPILGNRTWKVPSPLSRNIHLQERNFVLRGWRQKITPIAPLGSLIHIRFLLGLRLVRKFNGKMFSVIQSPPDRWLIVQGADQRWKFSCSSLFLVSQRAGLLVRVCGKVWRSDP